MAGGLGELKRLAPYHGYRAGSWVARHLPLRAVEGMATVAAGVVARRPSARRDMIRRHLKRVKGQHLDGDQLDRAVREAFESYGRYWLESFRLPDATPASLDSQMSYEGVEHLERALARGKGAIACLPHLGGWDFGGAWLATVGYPCTVVVEPVEPPELFRWFASFRESLGMTVVPLGAEAGRAIVSTLKSGGFVGLVCDRDIQGNGVEVEFFGERTTMSAGPATMALRTGAALLPMTVYFEGRRHHHGVVRPEIPVKRQGTLKEDVARITQLLAKELEAFIRVAPEQWHLFQPNWPSDRL